MGSWLLGGLGGNARTAGWGWAGWGWASPPCSLCWGLKPGVKTYCRQEAPPPPLPSPNKALVLDSSISVNYLFTS